MVRGLNRFRTMCLGIAISAVGFLLACGHKEAAPLSQGNENLPASSGAEPVEASLEQQTEQKLDPLTKDDVELYLKVMRAAADRVKARLPGDKAALESAKQILAGGGSGRVPTLDDVKMLERATLLALSMDQIVAEEMKIDGRTYRGIAEAIESVVSNPDPATASGGGGTPVSDFAPTPLEKRLSEVNVTNKKFLAPCQGEIQRLISVIHNPANLPK
jgi:hypothetical protein